MAFYGDFETGKTRGLKTAVWASHRGMLCIDPTPASMFRTVDAYRPTYGIDEFTKLTEDIQRITRASYKKGEKVPRIEKIKKERFVLSLFETFTPFILATTEKIPDMLLSRTIQITMKRAKDPNPERRDPEPEDFEDIREKLYLSRLTFANKVYENSKEIDKLNLGLYGRDYEIWKPILTIARVIGEQVFNNVLNLAKEMIEERKEHLHYEEKLLLQIIGDLFKEQGITTLEGNKQIEFSASEVLGALKEALLLDEYGEDEKRFYRDWNVQKIGIRLSRMGIRKTRKGKKGARRYLLTIGEYKDLCYRYSVNMSDLSDMSAKEGEASISHGQPTKIESSSKNFVGKEEEEKLGESLADKSDMSDKLNENIDTNTQTQYVLQKSKEKLDVSKVLYVLQEMGGEAGISALAMKLREQEGRLRLFLRDYPEYFVVKGNFVYLKARWEALKPNGNGKDVIGERSLKEGFYEVK